MGSLPGHDRVEHLDRAAVGGHEQRAERVVAAGAGIRSELEQHRRSRAESTSVTTVASVMRRPRSSVHCARRPGAAASISAPTRPATPTWPAPRSVATATPRRRDLAEASVADVLGHERSVGELGAEVLRVRVGDHAAGVAPGGERLRDELVESELLGPGDLDRRRPAHRSRRRRPRRPVSAAIGRKRTGAMRTVSPSVAASAMLFRRLRRTAWHARSSTARRRSR